MVIDTLAKNFGPEDENDTKAMVAFVDGCQRLQAAYPGSAILVVHHTGKNAKMGLRGAYALTANVHTVLMLKAVNGGPSLMLSNEKQKDGAKFKDIHLKRVVVDLGGGEKSCAISLDKAGTTKRTQENVSTETLKESEALEALRGFGAEGATSGAWQKATGWGRTKYDNIRRALCDVGKVAKQGNRYVCAEQAGRNDAETERAASA